ncbi:MAG TPA: RlmE family RNA methyltransferase [Nitrososphaerales archaeon]|nr:RlmE family RNA methyltransferase [Nitrososphaerales archaeon]
MRLHEARKDLYRRLAKEQGYKSRAAFKLIEANERYHFIDEGDTVVDFGAAPGGWLQVAARIVEPSGKAVGVDLHEIHLKERNAVAVAMDVNDEKVVARVLSIIGRKADVVLSDLAPSVSGVWELDQTIQVDLTLRVLALCESLLKQGGSAFLKLFEGERSPEVRTEMKRRFKTVHAVKPAASRSASSELYYYCAGWHGVGNAVEGQPRSEARLTASSTSA